ncbi:MAG: Asp-tRNA(Asn)/Glu-tRNA(Gln) amidotransferase subunit GatA [Parasphingorhabdus sp.]
MIDWDALESANEPLNAFTHFDRQADGSSGVLAGVTIGVKANIAVHNMPWTAGCEVFRERIAENDAAVVAKIREAGGMIIGTLNMEEAALGAKTDNPWFGKTYNPHKEGYTPGGSSGGSGAAVAAGLCDVALGTDTMGSVRVPSAYCGVYGFKPAQSSISQEGLELTEQSLDCIGPIARNLDLLEKATRIISDFGEEKAMTGSLATLVETGVDCQLEVIENFRDIMRWAGETIAVSQLQNTLSRIRFAGFIKAAKFLAKQFDVHDQSKLSDGFRKLIAYGPARKAADWEDDQAILKQTAETMQQLVAKHGFCVLPTTPQAAFPHSEDAPANQADYTCLANVSDLPAISIPSGFDDNGMPLGLQIITAKGCEADLFALARKLDDKLRGYRRPDNYLK